ncbi:unnamed protein product [Urochloa humidicola]
MPTCLPCAQNITSSPAGCCCLLPLASLPSEQQPPQFEETHYPNPGLSRQARASADLIAPESTAELSPKAQPQSSNLSPKNRRKVPKWTRPDPRSWVSDSRRSKRAEKPRHAAGPELIRSRSCFRPPLLQLSPETLRHQETTAARCRGHLESPMHARRTPDQAPLPKPPPQAAPHRRHQRPHEHENPPPSSGDPRPRRQRAVTPGSEHRAVPHSPPAAESGGASTRRELEEAAGGA